MAFENWPQTNWHELNLDWLLSKVKDLSEKVTDDYNKIYKAISDGDSKTLDSANSQSKNYTDKEIAKLKNELNQQIMNDIKELNETIRYIYNYIDAGDTENRRYIDYSIIEVYNNLNNILKDKELKVYNPCRGSMDNTANCINDLYTYLAVHGVSGLDSEYFTVNSIEDENLSALKFDLYSKKKLINVFNDTKMFSAYTGEIQTVQNEVGLNTLNSLSLSPGAENFENTSVSDVDNLDASSFDFDFRDNSVAYITNVPSGTTHYGQIDVIGDLCIINSLFRMSNAYNIPATYQLGTLALNVNDANCYAIVIAGSEHFIHPFLIENGVIKFNGPLLFEKTVTADILFNKTLHIRR